MTRHGQAVVRIGAIAAAGANNGMHLRIDEHILQLSHPSLDRPGKVQILIEDGV